MKKIFVLPMLISLAMICSCQKQDSTAETQLAQRKTELDAREETLIQREKAVEERENAVAEREKAVANSPILQPQRHALDAAQAEAEREKRLQQLPPELRSLIPDRSRMNAGRPERNPTINRRPVQTPRSLEDLQKKAGVANAFTSPAAEVPPPSPSPTPQ
jgi:uncharacterized protein (DUF3084 family)